MNLIRNLLLFIALFLSKQNAFTQFQLEIAGNIPVSNQYGTLNFPWFGGLNHVQLSEIDIDYDGINELFIFDKSGNQVFLFKTIETNGQKKYKPIPYSHHLFPADLRNRVTLVDFNNDGKNDIFTYGVGGIKVYKNIGNQSIGIQWELYTPLIKTKYIQAKTNLYVSSVDIPALVDVDHDGDLDILTFNIGGDRMEYHQNQSIEKFGIPDSLDYELKNPCWGRFSENENNNEIILFDTDYPCSASDFYSVSENEIIDNTLKTSKRHAGSTILAFDVNGNNYYDLLLGDIAYSSMTFLRNGASQNMNNPPMIEQDNFFPSYNIPINMHVFPAAFNLDVDHDGIKDLIVTTNATEASKNRESIHFYKNIGDNQNHIYSFQTNAFLQKEMLDLGFNSQAILHDFNQDGLTDMLLTSEFYFDQNLDKKHRFELYENIGTLTNPHFSLVDSNFLNLDTINYNGRKILTFGDIDQDGDTDLVIGSNDGSIHFYINESSNNLFTFSSPIILNEQNGQEIKVNYSATPQLFDLNQDGKLDLIIGKRTGEISYYKNVSSNQQPSFELVTHFLGLVNTSTTSDGFSSPHFFKFNDTIYLACGSADGTLRLYGNIESNIHHGGNFQLLKQDFYALNLKRNSSFFCLDINNDQELDVFATNDLGGVQHFINVPNSTLQTEAINIQKINIYPNPNKGTFQISTLENLNLNLEIINEVGQKIPFHRNGNQIQINDDYKGVFILKSSTLEETFFNRIIIL